MNTNKTVFGTLFTFIIECLINSVFEPLINICNTDIIHDHVKLYHVCFMYMYAHQLITYNIHVYTSAQQILTLRVPQIQNCIVIRIAYM